MADTRLFTRLQRLFSTDVIIRNQGGNQLKVMEWIIDNNLEFNKKKCLKVAVELNQFDMIKLIISKVYKKVNVTSLIELKTSLDNIKK